jgi:methionyl-tRNA formyltransferase
MGSTVIQISNGNSSHPRILFWGMAGELSRLALDHLVKSNVRPEAVLVADFDNLEHADSFSQVLPEPMVSALPITNPFLSKTIYQTAWENELPIFNMRNLASKNAIRFLSSFQPTIALVVCFPRKIPSDILRMPTAGFLNLHPSLLPELRGPYPLFWTFRLNKQPGVTIHFMDEGLDTGAIVSQKKLTFPDGISGPIAEELVAEQGASLLAEAVQQFTSGSLNISPQVDKGSEYGQPNKEDFVLPTTWEVRHAFNFVRGTADWGHVYTVQGPDFRLKIRSAATYCPNETLNQSHLQNGKDIWIQFRNGTLLARE